MPSARTRSFITAWLYWQSRSFLSVLWRAPGRALAQEAQAPRVEPRIAREPHADRRLGAPQRLPEHARGARRRPREGVAGRDDACVAAGRLEPERVLFLHERDLVAGLAEEIGGGDADDAAAEDQRLHRARLKRRGGTRRARDRPDRRGAG